MYIPPRFIGVQGALTSVFLCFVLMHNSATADSFNHVAEDKTLSLRQAILMSMKNDFALKRSKLNVKSYMADAASKQSLPDPILFASMQNLPTDTFDLDQEPMTQMRVGLKQMFPKGDSVELSRNVVRYKASITSSQHVVDALRLRQSVETAWLETWYWQKNKMIVEQDRVFLTQILDFNQSMYQLGSKNQSDLIGAELELIKLDEKLLDAERHYLQHRQSLHSLVNQTLPQPMLASVLPDMPFNGVSKKYQLLKQLHAHPEIQTLDLSIKQMTDKVRLVEQDEKAQWGVELSYGIRQGDHTDGASRSDLLTAGINVQLPLFSHSTKRQASTALRYKQAAQENKRLERLQKIYFEIESARLQYENTVSQRTLYETRILPTLIKQKDSALQSYQADKGDFRAVTDLYLKEQMTKLKQLRLEVTEKLLISKLNYWLDVDSIYSYLNRSDSADQEITK